MQQQNGLFDENIQPKTKHKKSGCSWFALFTLLAVTLVLLAVVLFNGGLPAQVETWLRPLPTVQTQPTLPAIIQPVELERAGTFRYHYSNLTELQRQAYRAIQTQLPHFPESIDMPNLTEDDMRAVFSAITLDQPMFFQISTTNYRIRTQNDRVVAFVPQYRLTREEYQRRMHAVAQAAQAIAVPQGGTDFDIQLALHDYVVQRATYSDDLADGNGDVATVYGALVRGLASCVGYAQAMQLLLELHSIPSFVVTGDATNATFSGPHAWNKVHIDGNWYHLDATWNDPVMDGGREIVSRAYFNLSSAEIAPSHEITLSRNAANSHTQNYFRRRGLYFTEIDRYAEIRIAAAIIEAVNADRGVAELRMASPEAHAQAVELLFGRNPRIHRILAAADPNGTLINTRNVYHSSMEQLNIIRIFPIVV
ncbi:MAG: hypothetical protein FWD06_02800 [Oscillospiraceae bacterium]|nr:hypothetical protein [Oscillospiraceae bacterium]